MLVLTPQVSVRPDLNLKPTIVLAFLYLQFMLLYFLEISSKIPDTRNIDVLE